jgi:hypothetical protein
LGSFLLQRLLETICSQRAGWIRMALLYWCWSAAGVGVCFLARDETAPYRCTDALADAVPRYAGPAEGLKSDCPSVSEVLLDRKLVYLGRV